MVPHPLEIVRDTDRSDQEAEVAGDRLLEAKEVEAAPLHLELDPVDGDILVHDLARESAIAAAHRVERL